MIQAEPQRLHSARIHESEGWLQPHHAAERRRNPDRSAGVGSGRHVHHLGRHSDSRPSARSARRSLGVMRIPDRAEMWIVRRDPVRQLVQAGLAHHHGARRVQLSHHRRVRLRHKIGEELRSRRGSHAPGPDQILVRDGNAVQRSSIAAACQLRVQFPRPRSRCLRSHGHESVEPRVELRNLVEALAGQLHRRHSAPSKPGCRLANRQWSALDSAEEGSGSYVSDMTTWGFRVSARRRRSASSASTTGCKRSICSSGMGGVKY